MANKAPVVTGVIIVFVLIVAIGTLVLSAITLHKVLTSSDSGNGHGTTPTPDTCGTRSSTWFNDACCVRQCEKGWSTLPTLVISLDAFRADYLLRNLTSSLYRLIECGSHAPYMFPSYPSKTYPNHYAIVTGLYPESHGIIDNVMYDPSIEPPADQMFNINGNTSYNPQWWGGEPIWNTVTKNGKNSAAVFWPGSDIPIQGMLPTYWYPYDGSTPFITRMDRIIDWLLLNDTARPSIMNIYFDEPDNAGHHFGPMSRQVDNQLVMVDGFINYLMNKLYDNGLFHCVNKIILADHGMETVNGSSFISVSDYIPYRDQTAYNMLVFPGPVGRIQFTETNYTVDQAMNATRCKDDRFRVYKRLEMPKRLHYSASGRIGDVVMDADPQVEIYTNGKPTRTKTGDHGYDYKAASMHALFVAHGPAFKQNYTIPPFQNVELYNLFSDLLSLKQRAPNNGTEGSLYAILRDPPSPPSRNGPVEPQQCPVAQDAPAKDCGDCSFLNQHSLTECAQPKILAKAQPEWSKEMCLFEKQSIIYENVTGQPVAVQSLVSAKTQMISWAPSRCSILESLGGWAISQCADIDEIDKMLVMYGASMYPLQPFDSDQNTCAADWFSKGTLYDGFFTGPWASLQNLTLTYAKSFGNLLVISGVLYDYDGDGLPDSYDVIRQRALNVTGSATVYFPSHVYQILIRCVGSQWDEDGKCAGNATALSFVLPNKPVQDNCQSTSDYLYMHTARIRDIELLTGLEFFSDWPFDTAIAMRIRVNQDLW